MNVEAINGCTLEYDLETKNASLDIYGVDVVPITLDEETWKLLNKIVKENDK